MTPSIDPQLDAALEHALVLFENYVRNHSRIKKHPELSFAEAKARLAAIVGERELLARTDAALQIREGLVGCTGLADRAGVEHVNDYIEANETELATLRQKGKAMTDIQPEREALMRELKKAIPLLYAGGVERNRVIDFILADRQAQRSRICGEILKRTIPEKYSRKQLKVLEDVVDIVEEVEHGKD